MVQRVCYHLRGLTIGVIVGEWTSWNMLWDRRMVPGERMGSAN